MSNEWYTPPEHIESVRAVLKRIDLDPASCEFANRTVKADRFYSKEDNGLMHSWYGHIYLNPPYGKTDQGGASYLEAFTRKLIEEYFLHHVGEPSNGVSFGTCFVYFGRNEERFVEVFSKYGHVAMPSPLYSTRPIARELWAESEALA